MHEPDKYNVAIDPQFKINKSNKSKVYNSANRLVNSILCS